MHRCKRQKKHNALRLQIGSAVGNHVLEAIEMPSKYLNVDAGPIRHLEAVSLIGNWDVSASMQAFGSSLPHNAVDRDAKQIMAPRATVTLDQMVGPRRVLGAVAVERRQVAPIASVELAQ